MKFVLDNRDWKPEPGRSVEDPVEEIYRPVRNRAGGNGP